MVARKARKDKVDLPVKFWMQERWKREFLLQVRHAAGLLRLYSVAAIVAALRTPKGKQAFSLKAPFLDPLIRVEQERVDRRAPPAPAEPTSPAPPAELPPPVVSPRPSFGQPTTSTLSKLR